MMIQIGINVTVRILSGRNQELKTLLSNSILNELKNINLKPISITIEISGVLEIPCQFDKILSRTDNERRNRI